MEIRQWIRITILQHHQHSALILEQIITMPRVPVDMLKDKSAMEKWVLLLQQKSNDAVEGDGSTFEISVQEDIERHIFIPQVALKHHSIETIYYIGNDFFNSGEYRAITDFGEKVNDLLEQDAYVQRGDKTKPVTSFKHGARWHRYRLT